MTLLFMARSESNVIIMMTHQRSSSIYPAFISLHLPQFTWLLWILHQQEMEGRKTILEPRLFWDNLDDEDDLLVECLIEEEIFLDLRTTSVSQNEGEERILNLLISLYTHLPSKYNGFLYSPLLQFIILSFHQHSGEWLPLRRIMELFSNLLFSGQQIMYTLMQQAVLEGQGIRYTKWVLLS